MSLNYVTIISSLSRHNVFSVGHSDTQKIKLGLYRMVNYFRNMLRRKLIDSTKNWIIFMKICMLILK
jgi:hypothetical protein